MTLAEFLETQAITQADLAEKLGVTQSAVSQWLTKSVPAGRVKAVVLATGGVVSAHDLRPDLYAPGMVFTESAA